VVALVTVACSSGVPEASAPASPERATAAPTNTDPADGELEDIVDIVRDDPRVSALLAANEYIVDGAFPRSDGLMGVSIEFAEPAPTDGWPELTACDIGGAVGPATGLDFLVDLTTRRVVAMSPGWGDVNCLSFDEARNVQRVPDTDP
jgi:hypothetical protein